MLASQVGWVFNNMTAIYILLQASLLCTCYTYSLYCLDPLDSFHLWPLIMSVPSMLSVYSPLCLFCVCHPQYTCVLYTASVSPTLSVSHIKLPTTLHVLGNEKYIPEKYLLLRLHTFSVSDNPKDGSFGLDWLLVHFQKRDSPRDHFSSTKNTLTAFND